MESGKSERQTIENPLEALGALAELGQAIRSAAGLSLLIAVIALGTLIAYLSARAHASGYATFSLRAVTTWYTQLIQILAILAVAVGFASLLNVGIGAATSAAYSFPQKITSADFPSIAYEGVVAVGGGLIVLLTHRRFQRFVEPNHVADIARRFRVAALSIVFGTAAAVLLFAFGTSLVDYHVGSPGDAAASAHPGRPLSGLVVAVVFWTFSLFALRREFRPIDE